MRIVELNMTKENCADFIDWLANDNDGFGHTLTTWEINHGIEKVQFRINGNMLSNYSSQLHQVVINGAYCYTGGIGGYVVDGKSYTALDYCLMKLGFKE